MVTVAKRGQTAKAFPLKRNASSSPVTGTPPSLSDAVTEKNYTLYEFSVTSVSTVFSVTAFEFGVCSRSLVMWNRDSA